MIKAGALVHMLILSLLPVTDAQRISLGVPVMFRFVGNGNANALLWPFWLSEGQLVEVVGGGKLDGPLV